MQTTRVIAVGNEKGGVGKTTIAVNLAASAAAQGARVLLIDSDPTFRATQVLGVDPSARPSTLAEVYLQQAGVSDAVTATEVDGVDLLMAGPALGGVSRTLSTMNYAEFRLRLCIGDYLESCSYDIVLLDTPPSKGLLLSNALQVADEVLCVVDLTDDGSIQGVLNTLRHIREMAAVPSARVPAMHVLRNHVDRRARTYRQIMAPDELDLPGVCRQVGVTLLETEVPETREFANSATQRRTLVSLRCAPTHRPLAGAQAALAALAAELGVSAPVAA